MDEYEKWRESQLLEGTRQPKDWTDFGPAIFVPTEPRTATGHEEPTCVSTRPGASAAANETCAGRRLPKAQSVIGIGVLAFAVAVFGFVHRSSQIFAPSNASGAKESTVGDPPKPTPTAQEVYEHASPSVVTVIVRDGAGVVLGIGSGFFVDRERLLVTNYHVIELAFSATVTVPGRKELAVEGVVAANAKRDLAILQVRTGNAIVSSLALANDSLPPVGIQVYAIGTPKGYVNTLSRGLVSGVREIDGQPWVQIDAPISPGSSGGPLLNQYGEVIGVTTCFCPEGQNLNFAIPVSAVRPLLKRGTRVVSLAEFTAPRRHQEEKGRSQEVDLALLQEWDDRGIIYCAKEPRINNLSKSL